MSQIPGLDSKTHMNTQASKAFEFHFLVSSVRAVDVLTDVSVSWINTNSMGKLSLRQKSFKVQPQYANEVELSAFRMGFVAISYGSYFATRISKPFLDMIFVEEVL